MRYFIIRLLKRIIQECLGILAARCASCNAWHTSSAHLCNPAGGYIRWGIDSHHWYWFVARHLQRWESFHIWYNRWHTHTIAIQILPFSCCGISFLLINLSYEYLRFCMCILSCLNLIHCTKDTIRCHPMSTLFSYKFVAWIATKTPLLIAFYQQRYLIEIIHYFIICYA